MFGLVLSLLALVLLYAARDVAVAFFNPFHAHEHCIQVLGSAFHFYANDHEGKYPYHTNGFGDALLLLVKEDQLPGPDWITAPGDDGKMFKECLEKGLDVPEEKCTRIYIQGLSESNANDNVVMVFDKYPTRGGDHFPRPWGRPSRDVVMSDASGESVLEERWPAFANEQIERLVKIGFKRTELEKLFGLQPKAAVEKQ